MAKNRLKKLKVNTKTVSPPDISKSMMKMLQEN